MVRIMFNKSRERSSLKGKLLCMAMVVMMAISFTPLHVFAGTEAANDSGGPNDYGTEAYWEKYFNVDSINYYDSSIDEDRVLDDEYTDGCGEKGVYFLKENHEVIGEDGGFPRKNSALTIKGQITLIFVKSTKQPNGPTLNLKGVDSKYQSVGGAGIELTEGNSLLVKGIGELNAKGGNGSAGSNGSCGGSDGNGETGRVEKSLIKAGQGGDGGSGGGGAGAGIGTEGSFGAAAVRTDDNNWIDIKTFDDVYDDSYVLGVNSTNGKTSNPTSNAGQLKIAGNVKVNAVGGEEKKNSMEKNEAGSCTWVWEDNVLNFDGDYDTLFNAGGGGGGGQGGAGFYGASIGSGGVGGASGGTGGSGTVDCYTEQVEHPKVHFFPGGGGGAGAGSDIAQGGKGYKGYGQSDASDGQNADKEHPGNGGSGAVKNIIHGITGGKGGSLENMSGNGGTCYSVNCDTGTGSEPNYAGKEAKMQRAFPVDECKVVFTNSVKDNVYKYTGNQITPCFKVIHAPTNTVVNEKAYNIFMGENINPGAGSENNHVEICSAGMGDHDLLMDKTMTKAEGSIIAPIEIKYEAMVTGIPSIGKVTYDGKSPKPDLSKLIIRDETTGKDMTEELKPLLKIYYSKDGTVKEWTNGIGEYTMTAMLENDIYMGSATQKFEILPCVINASSGSAISRKYIKDDDSVKMRKTYFDNLPAGVPLYEDLDYVMSDGKMDGDQPGEHDVEFTVELKNKNFVFENGTKTQVCHAKVEITK